MEVDHIIIFSDNRGNEAEELVKFGLIEGSNRIHPGQGTRNRKFYFENFFLEIVWVHDKKEIMSVLTAPTRLWERADHRKNGCSPPLGCVWPIPGIMMVCSKDAFSIARAICPRESRSISSLTSSNPACPGPVASEPNEPNEEKPEEPTDHEVGIRRLTKIIYEIPLKSFHNRFTDLPSRKSKIVFENAEHYGLTLEFDHCKTGLSRQFSTVPLLIKYSIFSNCGDCISFLKIFPCLSMSPLDEFLMHHIPNTISLLGSV